MIKTLMQHGSDSKALHSLPTLHPPSPSTKPLKNRSTSAKQGSENFWSPFWRGVGVYPTRGLFFNGKRGPNMAQHSLKNWPRVVEGPPEANFSTRNGWERSGG